MEPKPYCDAHDTLKSTRPPPGEFPFTRGLHSMQYAKRLWTMRQYAGFGDSAESNKRYHYLLSQGITGLSVAFDLPTQMGYDSDAPEARGEVGRVGVALCTLDDMRVLLDKLPLDQVSTSMTINATALILLAFYIAVAEERGVAREKLRGTIQNDLLKEYMARGTYIFPPQPSLRITTDIFEFCAQELPEWNTISISGYHIREAGSTAVHEIAFTLSNGCAYVEAALRRNLNIDSFAPRLSFFFNVHNHFMEEVAKFRAARHIWAHLMRERFHAQNPKSWQLRFHAQTAGSTLIASQIETNAVRVTLQCLAAVLGGAQSIHTNSQDEALGLPTEEAARLALRTQQIIAFETGITELTDPLGGSYECEKRTDALIRDAGILMADIESRGGAVAALEAGFQQELIQQAAYAYQTEIENSKRIIVGQNAFQETNAQSPPVLKIDSAVEKRQVVRLLQFKAKRNEDQLKQVLKGLDRAAAEDANLLGSVLSAVKVGATLGEIIAVLEKRFGRFRPQF